MEMYLIECMKCEETKMIKAIDWKNGKIYSCLKCEKQRFKIIGKGILI